MEVFSKSYLEAVVRTQGELFDSFARQNPDCDTDDFITAYMTGKTRADIDAGQAYVCTMNAQELINLAVAKVSAPPAELVVDSPTAGGR